MNQNVIDKAVKGIGAATNDLASVLRKMEERSRQRMANHQLDVKRYQGLLNRETATSPKRTKLLRQLQAAERMVKQEEAYLANVLSQLRNETEKAVEESNVSG